MFTILHHNKLRSISFNVSLNQKNTVYQRHTAACVNVQTYEKQEVLHQTCTSLFAIYTSTLDIM